MTTAPLALVVGNDGPMRATLRFLLEDAGCRVIEINDTIVDPMFLRTESPALIALITGQGDVVHHLTHLRKHSPASPLLVLGRGITHNLRRRAFSLGVHGVLSLPIAAVDLQHQLHNALTAVTSPAIRTSGTWVSAGGLILRPGTHIVIDGNGWTANLTRREVALMAVLMASPGRVVPYGQLAVAIWPDGVRDEHNALAALVGRLRVKLAARACVPDYLRNVRGYGYLFEAHAAVRVEEALSEPGAQPVLVIDDDEATRRYVDDVLVDAGYAVVQGSGAQAPSLARQAQPRLVLLDIDMPDMDGVEVCQRLRAHPRTMSIPIIAFSAGFRLRANLCRLAIDDCLRKPFDIDELLIRVERWAGSPT